MEMVTDPLSLPPESVFLKDIDQIVSDNDFKLRMPAPRMILWVENFPHKVPDQVIRPMNPGAQEMRGLNDHLRDLLDPQKEPGI